MKKKSDKYLALLFILPAFILFTIFVIVPVLSIFYYSLFDWVPNGELVFIGLNNFKELFGSDEFRMAIMNNLKFLVIAVPLWTLFPLIIAILLFEKVKHWKMFKSAFYLPAVLSVTIMSTIFRTFFMYDGPVNQTLELFGKSPIEFWALPNVSIVLIVIFINWISFGGSIMFYMSGLANFSNSVHEASLIDGANWLQRFIKIQIPLLKPTIAVIMMLNIICVFSGLFTSIYMMTGGGPGYGTTTLEYLMYTSAFQTHRFGYASAVAVVLFLIIMVLGIIQNKFTKVAEGEL